MTISNIIKFLAPVNLFFVLLLAACQSSNQSNLPASIETLALPADWVGGNIGTATGSGDYNSGTYTVNGTGAGIGGTADNFYFVRKRPSSTNNNPTFDDGYIVARVNVSSSTFPVNSLAGIMMRETLTAGSRNALIGIKRTGTSTYQVIFQSRSSTGGSTIIHATTTTTVPRLVKLERQNNIFRAYYTTDGVTWSQLGNNANISMTTTSPIYMGLAVTSSGSSTQATGTFTGVFNRHIFYISPSGSDTNSGIKFNEPWKTFSHALPLLNPGEVLVLKNGTYTKSNSGLLHIVCTAAGGTAQNGTAADTTLPITSLKVTDLPITVRAYTERQAVIDTNGSTETDQPYAVLIQGCSYWVLQGIAARNRDIMGMAPPPGTAVTNEANAYGHVFYVKGDSNNSANSPHHIILRRILAYWPNRYGNNHALMMSHSDNILVEESEVYAFHRHGIDAYGSTNVTVLRSYANSLNQRDRLCHADDPFPGCTAFFPSGAEDADGKSHTYEGGDEAFVLYGSSDSKVINSITENKSEGFQAHATVSGGQNNVFYGNIALNSIVGALVDTRGLNTSNVYEPTNTLFKDLLIINSQDNNIGLRSTPYNSTAPTATQNVRFQNITVYGEDYAGVDYNSVTSTKGMFLHLKDYDEDGIIQCAHLSTGKCGFYMNNGLIWANDEHIRNYSTGSGCASPGPCYPNFRIENSTFHSNSSQSTFPNPNNYVNVTFSLATLPTTPPNSFSTTTFIYQAVSYPFLVWSSSTLGADVRYRYNIDGTLTTTPLWSPTGFIACGAELPTSMTGTGGIFAGIYSMGKCKNIHQKLGVTSP